MTSPHSAANDGGSPGGHPTSRVTDTTDCPYTTTGGPVLQAVTFDRDLYPRAYHDPTVIARYRDCLDQLPPIVLADTPTTRNVLVDGYHRWQAHQLEGSTPTYEHLGTLTPAEVLRESIRRNAHHGHQLR